MRKGLGSIAALVGASALLSSFASADVQHTIAKGHTIQAIANRYHVTPKSIIEANHLKDVRHLRIGDVLIIPKAEAPKDGKAKDKDGKAKGKDGTAKDKDSKAKDKDGKAKVGKGAANTATKPTTYAAKPKTPGVIHIKRAGSTEEADLRITDKSGKIAASTLRAMEKMLRFPTGATHPIEPRLISLLGIISNHFGSRKIEVISGFRPYVPTQYTVHSNHNHGKAIDFRVVGVPNEAVRDFCRTLRNVGCGYYPNSTFVHLDVRESSAFWVDYSKPGEPPRYNAANVEADEGTSDVQGNGPLQTNPPPAEDEPSEPAPTSDSTTPTTETKPDGE